MKIIGIIPARYDSTRFPGKPLIDLNGKSMIQRVYDQCKKSKNLDQVIVATDDQRIFDHVQSFGGEVRMSSNEHKTGTSRVAEIAKAIHDAQIIVNIQGDEPTISPLQIDELVEISGNGIATQAKRLTNEEDLFNPNVVKVIFNKAGKALYFSRQTIPYGRNIEKEKWSNKFEYYQHIGLYSFDRNTLFSLENLGPSGLEEMESLEQLRWLDHNIPISIGITAYSAVSVDTPEDAERVRNLLSSEL